MVQVMTCLMIQVLIGDLWEGYCTLQLQDLISVLQSTVEVNSYLSLVNLIMMLLLRFLSILKELQVLKHLKGTPG